MSDTREIHETIEAFEGDARALGSLVGIHQRLFDAQEFRLRQGLLPAKDIHDRSWSLCACERARTAREIARRLEAKRANLTGRLKAAAKLDRIREIMEEG
jgi:hypothetical protein